jgi:surface antigen
VGYVEKINSDGSVVMSEMNYDLHNAFRFITIRPGSYWPDGFIHVG